MVPTPPSPSTISALFTDWGAILGMRVSASRTRALNNLGGGMTEVDSSEYVKTPMVMILELRK